MKYARIIELFMKTPWAILPEKLMEIQSFLELAASGTILSDEQIKERIGAAEKPQPRMSGSVAVIPVYGVVSQRLDMFSEISGGTSTENLAKRIKAAVADDSVGSILLDVDSPGGSVFGIAELAKTISEAKGQKRVVAIANSTAASAAYWIASSADELIVTPGGEVGAIGVITAHYDWSAFVNATEAGARGLPTVTYISAGKFKAEGNPYEPLTDEAKAAIQSRVDEYYGAFVKAVASGRGTTPAVVRSGFGEARMVGASEAVSLGMADRVATFDETISRMVGKKRSTAGRQATAKRRIDLAKAR